MDERAESPLTGFELEDLIEIVERRKWWLVLGAVVGLGLGALGTYVLPPRYKANTTILVEPQRVPESYIQSTVTLEIEQRLNTLRQRVTSHSNLNELIEAIGPERLDPSGELSREQLMSRVQGGLEVEIGGTGRFAAPVFEITYAGKNPQVVADVVREVASLFITENIKDRAQQATATAEFLDRELARLRDEVAGQEEHIRNFRLERMGQLPSQLDANLRALDRLNLELAGNLEAQEAISQRVALLRRQIQTASAEVMGTPDSPSAMAATLQALKQELLQAQRIYTEAHPNVKRLREEIARLEEALAAAPPEPINDGVRSASPAVRALRQEIEAAGLDLAARQRQEERIREQIESMQVRVEQTPRREQELRELTRDYDNLMETYRGLLSKKYEAALARNLEQAQQGERFKLLRPARVPDAPVFPDLKLFLPGGLALGLALAAFAVGIAEFRHPAFRSVNRLTRMIGLPVFASIPRIDNEQIFETPPDGEVEPKLVVHTAPESAPAEQYRGFLPIFVEAEDCRVILVTSAARGDGKTLTCMNLALSLAADLNNRVLVIDGDLRRPKVHRLVRVSRKRGLSNILRREARLDECAVNSKIPKVTVLPAGPTVRNPLALLTDKSFLELLAEARSRYDVILIDAPPLLPVVDSKILRKMADMVLFVVRADATPREAVVRSLRDMRDVAGVIFNQVSAGSFRRYYYYDAYARYAYGDEVAGDEADERA